MQNKVSFIGLFSEREGARERIAMFPKIGMRWLRLVGALKIEVSFAKGPYKKDYILQKTPIF